MEFRSYNQEQTQIAQRNRKQTLLILAKAGIDENNPDFMRYYRATVQNVHNAYRFSYNGETPQQLEAVFESFVSSIQDFPLSLYEQQTAQFLEMRVQKQFQESVGGNAEPLSYEETRSILDATIKNGLKIRKRKKTRFPKEFYDEKGNLQRLVYEMDGDDQNLAAMSHIDRLVKKYDSVSFDTQKNRFIVNGMEVGPQKFFASKAEKLEKFFKKTDEQQTSFNTSDLQLLNILQQADFKAFQNLRKERALSSNKQNENLRTALNDEVIFYELSELWQAQENKTFETLKECMHRLQTQFQKSAEIVSFESQKNVLGRIDRIMFSPIPEDVATQSTFKDWVSCMHPGGSWHDRVQHSIGLGSIVAYGYDSRNPSKIISRILINPYHSKLTKKVAYHANKNIYGLKNSGFKDVVGRVVEQFNTGRNGVFYRDKELYPDGNVSSFQLLKIKNGVLDLRSVKPGEKGIINLQNLTLPKADKVLMPHNHTLRLRYVTLSEGLDLSNIKNLELCSDILIEKNVKLPQTLKYGSLSLSGYIPDNTNLEHADRLTLHHEIHVGQNVRLPNDVRAQNANILDGSDLSSAKTLIAENKFMVGKNVILPKNVDLLDAEITEDTDLSKVENLVLSGRMNLPKNLKLPQNTAFMLHEIGGYVPQDLDLHDELCIRFSNNLKNLPKSVKLPNRVFISTIPENTDLSKVSDLNLEGEVFIGKNVKLPENFSLDTNDRIKTYLSGYIPNNLDLSGKTGFIFGAVRRDHPSVLHTAQNLKLPETITFENVSITEGCDFRSAKNAVLTGHIKILSHVMMPDYVEISDASIADGSDLSQIKNLVIGRGVFIGKNVKLPETVKFKRTVLHSSSKTALSGYIPDNADLTAWTSLYLKGPISVGKNIKFPQYVRIVDASIANGSDLSQIENLELSGSIKTQGTVIFPEKVRLVQKPNLRTNTNRDIFDENKYKITIQQGSDLSGIEQLQITPDVQNLNIEENVILPKNISCISLTISGKIPDRTDLSHFRSLTLQEAEIGKNIKFPKHCKLDEVILKDISPDFSDVKDLTIANTNLENYNISFSEISRVDIEPNTKFGNKVLDLSKCDSAYVHPSVKCQEIKLPKKASPYKKRYILPKQVKEISTLYIASTPHIAVPAKTKIIDEPDENGKLISLSLLKEKGVRPFHLFVLQKNRLMNRLKNHQKQKGELKTNKPSLNPNLKNTLER